MCHTCIRSGSILQPDSLVDFREEKNQKKLDLYYLKVITLYSLKEIKYIKY